MKLFRASLIESELGATTAPKFHGLLNQPFEDAELAPLVARLGVLVSETAPASRAGHVVSSVHSPAGNVFFTVGVETAF